MHFVQTARTRAARQMRAEKGDGADMQELESQTVFRPGADGSFTFLLSGEQRLNLTGCKVMRNLREEGLAAGYVSRLNGCARLVYDLEQCLPLSALAGALTPKQFLDIIRDLFRILDVICANGFLRPENTLLSADRILIDRALRARLIYLPVDGPCGATAGLNSPERELRQTLTELAARHVNLRSPDVDRWCGEARAAEASEPGAERGEPEEGGPFQLVRVGEGPEIVFDIDTSGTVIGRNPKKASAVLSDAAVSGEHCRLYAEAEGWKIEDLGSMNGTVVNGQRLPPRQPAPIRPGDVVQIVRHIFIAKMQVKRHGTV